MTDEVREYNETLKLHVDEMRQENTRLREMNELLRDENSRLSNENGRLRDMLKENGFGIIFNFVVDKTIEVLNGK
ncbi:MAG TPA: hypothetical protein PLB18_21430 [Acidobacteriota bacterium]|nr:hypothetical protein [Acidobacteriota bacterium]HND21944.1 hypothetical protein [Acidobacteriota bacterium]